MHSCTRLALDRFTSRSQSESESSSPLYACPDLRINRGIREHTRMKIDTEARRVTAHFTSCRIDSCARQPPPRRIAFSSREYLPPTTLCPPPPARPGLSTLRQVQVPDFRRCLARTSIFRAARARARASIRSDPSLRNPPLNSSKSPPPRPSPLQVSRLSSLPLPCFPSHSAAPSGDAVHFARRGTPRSRGGGGWTQSSPDIPHRQRTRCHTVRARPHERRIGGGPVLPANF
jgi:hypothetical protein